MQQDDIYGGVGMSRRIYDDTCGVMVDWLIGRTGTLLSIPYAFYLIRHHNLDLNNHHLFSKRVHLAPIASHQDIISAGRSMFKVAKSLFQRRPWPQLKFPISGFEVVSDAVLFEEEQFEEFHRGFYYPVNIGDVFASKYQVVGKLGFGVTSTVWLARDLQ